MLVCSQFKASSCNAITVVVYITLYMLYITIYCCEIECVVVSWFS